MDLFFAQDIVDAKGSILQSLQSKYSLKMVNTLIKWWKSQASKQKQLFVELTNSFDLIRNYKTVVILFFLGTFIDLR